ncbi:uncharacterized protein LOC116245948 [Nymphaea colorata]|uniref:Uncharacterized protein n=1 Tax=Nymphaea colorata TaxID=210225 RepID=A0A5K0UYX3_9MAGN|nr:uncharacterized protein LOC116245948 [Nymphaea colorata]
MASKDQHPKQQQQLRRPEQAAGQEELPLESSPYVKHNLEEYKQEAYGTQGHMQPVDRGAGSTDAPTPSGGTLPESKLGAVRRAAP